MHDCPVSPVRLSGLSWTYPEEHQKTKPAHYSQTSPGVSFIFAAVKFASCFNVVFGGGDETRGNDVIAGWRVEVDAVVRDVLVLVT